MIRHSLLLFVALLLSACGLDGYRVNGRLAPAPVEVPDPHAAPAAAGTAGPEPGVVTMPLPDQPKLPEPVVEPLPEAEAEPAPPATQLLLASAQQQLESGDHGLAAATLERALRIAPKDARLWHELARVRLAAGEWQQAIELANKSRVLAGDDAELRRKNSELIAAASEHL